ncbi:hypothetical protein [Streptomyces europaeiscabiei]|nr:hypothetical protein [Streptomyces europaeiscabiei]MDX2527846.1 hypothetical protein [Streptomyces europaeiscabiei]
MRSVVVYTRHAEYYAEMAYGVRGEIDTISSVRHLLVVTYRCFT